MGSSCAGKVAIVTGASRGIGVGIAQRLAAEGAKVAVTARSLRPEDHHLDGCLEETVQLINDAGGTAIPIVADLADPSFDAASVVGPAESAFGPVDILVNNAAAAFYIPFTEISDKRFTIAMNLNVHSPWKLMRAVIPSMRTRGGGHIVNISSVTALPPAGPPFSRFHAKQGATIYGGTKAMLDRFSAGVAAEEHEHNIAVNVLSPEAGVLTPGAVALVDLSDKAVEPMETMVEATLALCTGDARTLTAKITYSLTLIKELALPVYDLAGRELVTGWQPADIDDARLVGNRPRA